MPNVVLEAMAVGKPVVAFNVEGVQELLSESNAPELQAIEPGNVNAFIKAIEYLANNRAHAEVIGRENHNRAATLFELEQHLSKYETLYRQYHSCHQAQ